ncbi:hypothetical protein L0U88_07330 [Flavihumibacter sp. RY-1]|uniref:Thioredoxin domain-containing protein n=1 Tax=Flavihumibacter fluminis TaxID=2909236 RepID=A0ABS9BGM9_9BACT|nr:hypothetical protein [Flavihumibacter fluminis]MCF1714435.1 hypothetical protein [Flavihumibacter fluminis]
MGTSLKRYTTMILAAAAFGFVFTAILYNLGIQQFAVKYMLIGASYFLFYLFLAKWLKEINQYHIAISLAIVPFLIDASTVITNPALVPLRFPFSTTFLLIGIVSGLVLIKKSSAFYGLLLFFLIYSFLSWKYFIPSIIFTDQIVDNKKLDPSILSTRFLDLNRDTVGIGSSGSEIIFMELFFVGCAPCEKKEEMFLELYKRTPSQKFQTVFICEGRISSFEQFKQYARESKLKNKVQFLYNFDSSFNEKIQNEYGFPYELVFKNNQLIRTFSGYNDESFENHLTYRVSLLK